MNRGSKGRIGAVLSLILWLLVGAVCSYAQEAELKVSEAEAMKAAIKKEQPQYPPVARELRIEGKVEVEAKVTTAGEVEVVKAKSGHPVLAGAVVAAVKKWKFTPFTSEGKPTRAVVSLRFNFHM